VRRDLNLTLSPSSLLTRDRVISVLGAWLPAVVLLGAIAVRRWYQQGTFPTGLDGGQWLAIGRGLFGSGRATDGAYPPFVPLLVEFGQTLSDPMLTLKLLSIGSLLAVAALVYYIAQRRLSTMVAVTLTAAIGLTSAAAEPAAYGGYPQLLATAFLLGASAMVTRYLATGERRDLVGTAVGLIAAALTHHIYFPLALLTVTGIWLIWLTQRPPRHDAGLRSWGVLAAIASGLLAFAPTLIAFRAAGYAPPLDASQLGVIEAFRYGTRESPITWGIIIGSSLICLIATVRERRQPLWQIAAALMTVTLPLFILSAEVRLLLPILIAGTLGLGYGFQRLMESASGRVTPFLQFAPLFLILLWPNADRAAGDYFRFYQVVDQPLLDAADALDEAADGELAVVRHDRRGWPIGWWFEGLTDAKIAVGADRRWLGFPSERDQAAMASSFFDTPVAADRLGALAVRHDVRWLVFRKWEWIGWQRWVEAANPPVTIAYDDDEFMILAIR